MGGILVEADILTVMMIMFDEMDYRMSVKEMAKAEVIPTAEREEVAEMPRLISAELLMPAYPVYTEHSNVICEYTCRKTLECEK